MYSSKNTWWINEIYSFKEKLYLSRLQKILKLEKVKKIDSVEGVITFKKNCKKSKKLLREKIIKIKNSGKKICGYGATSKSTTILNYCNIDNKYIDFICDTTPEKIDKFSPGVHIPIKSMEYFYKNAKDYVYLFAWNHKKEIFKKEKKLLKSLVGFHTFIFKQIDVFIVFSNIIFFIIFIRTQTH